MPGPLFGSNKDGFYVITESHGDQMPFEIGSLAKEALSYLGEWKKFQKGENPFGIYYRMGIKTGVIDAERDPATVVLHFIAPYIREGFTMTSEMEATLEQTINQVIKVTTLIYSQSVDNAVGVRASPPDYMLNELYELLSK